MIRFLRNLVVGAACALAAWFLLLTSLVFAGPLPTIGALLFLTALAAWRGRDTTPKPTPGRERLPR